MKWLVIIFSLLLLTINSRNLKKNQNTEVSKSQSSK